MNLEYSLSIPEEYKKLFADFKARCLFQEQEPHEAILSLINGAMHKKQDQDLAATAPVRGQGLQTQQLLDELDRSKQNRRQARIRMALAYEERKKAEQKLTLAETKAQNALIENARIKEKLQRIEDLEQMLKIQRDMIRALERNVELLENRRPLIMSWLENWLRKKPQLKAVS